MLVQNRAIVGLKIPTHFGKPNERGRGGQVHKIKGVSKKSGAAAAVKHANPPQRRRLHEQQTTAKYAHRPSPPYKANAYCGATKMGQDGNMWRSVQNARGICQWRKISV
jgi:hypothetical protein